MGSGLMNGCSWLGRLATQPVKITKQQSSKATVFGLTKMTPPHLNIQQDHLAHITRH